MKDTYFVLGGFGNISLIVGPLWAIHMRAWLHLAGSKHNLTFPLGFGINTKPLHHLPSPLHTVI